MILTVLIIALILGLLYIPQIAEQWYLYGRVIALNSTYQIWYDDKFNIHIKLDRYHEINLGGITTKWTIKKCAKNGLTLEHSNESRY